MAGAELILFAHERRALRDAAQQVLTAAGFTVDLAAGGTEARERLKSRRYAALVVDVALPELVGYELGRLAKEWAGESATAGASVCVLVASVYRRTSYKRSPTRLYGADDYVEVHHLGDMLPAKLRALMAAAPSVAAGRAQVGRSAFSAVRAEGDARMRGLDETSLAQVIAADMVLYNGESILAASDLAAAEAAVSGDLDAARELYADMVSAQGRTPPSGDPIRDAFRRLMQAMGREELST